MKGMSIRAGVIDSGFRGEIKILITNLNDTPIAITKNGVKAEDICGNFLPMPITHEYEKAIAQLVLLPVPKVKLKEITYEELIKKESIRGIGMLGMSGK